MEEKIDTREVRPHANLGSWVSLHHHSHCHHRKGQSYLKFQARYPHLEFFFLTAQDTGQQFALLETTAGWSERGGEAAGVCWDWTADL